MDLSVYIFSIILDIFIVVTIFAIYLYVLFRYFMHRFEEIGIIKFLKIHLTFYEPIIKLYKISSSNITNPTAFPNYIESHIKQVVEEHINTDYSIATYAILGFVLGLFFILIVYFIIFHKKIMVQLSLLEILVVILFNAGLILMFELLFLYFVYGNIDLFNIAKTFNV